jgi:flagellar biosynthesis repressor protein FlbT
MEDRISCRTFEMPLKINLKPGEKLFIGGAVIRNDAAAHCELSILNDVPLLREKDILSEEATDSHCRRIYLCVQLMYMDPANLGRYQKQYAPLSEELLKAAPSTSSHISKIDADLARGHYYRALKNARQLVDYEQELIQHAQKTA